MTETQTAVGQDRPGLAWIWIAATLALLFECVGAFLLYSSLTLDVASLPLDQRNVYQAIPQWMNIAWAIAVATGLLGALGLLLRRKFAEPLLIVSFVAAVIQFSGLVVDRRLRELTSEADLMEPVVILILLYGIWHLAQLARKRGWLR
jgi:hypothetical protein